MIKISVIIPTYNRANLLMRSINSVLNQTYKDFELIVINDGSTDNTGEIVENLRKNDERIIYIKIDNSGGPAHPKNIGIKKAQGEYIAFLDDDDEWMPTKLEKQISLFEKTNKEDLTIVSCDSVVIDNKGETAVKTSKITNYGLRDLLIKNSIFTGTVLVRSLAIQNIDLFDEKLKFLEDWDMWIRILSKDKKIEFYPEILFKYNVGNTNTTKKINDVKKIEALEYVFKKNILLYEKYKISHIIMFRIGVKYYLAKKYEVAKRHFKHSFLKNKLYLPSYLGYFICLFGNLGNSIFNLSIKMYRMISGRQWGNKFN
jgi:glycosyltransferase involved in cell wall biosynthesis